MRLGASDIFSLTAFGHNSSPTSSSVFAYKNNRLLMLGHFSRKGKAPTHRHKWHNTFLLSRTCYSQTKTILGICLGYQNEHILRNSICLCFDKLLLVKFLVFFNVFLKFYPLQLGNESSFPFNK